MPVSLVRGESAREAAMAAIAMSRLQKCKTSGPLLEEKRGEEDRLKPPQR